ncbi:tripartite tricarboxylate transporter substrate binding protein [Pigmentiphaga kullae]|uniref:Tripartite-type tricarboxylate transporter receptor subunit TctC n=1 Tax=Pigmentiphaga kullae TaxID=151784 RepID=A0A4Q7NN63_9BURK|nr:tripartite tricarboxylate transporter substrate binding protein [Pigmentiphaga kullae]RZS86655.1 tripartite-type tricarboxylate transporter receptor subunit TctC [Pigmentiphaga kullae]
MRTATYLTGLVLFAASVPCLAQDFPTRPLRVVVPFPAGGGTDALARALGEGMGKELGQPVIVLNKPGAGTVIGNDMVAKSPPDGYTILLTTSAVAIVPSLVPQLPYAADTAFAPIALIGRAPNVMVTRMTSPLASGEEVIRQARATPGKLNYGSAGNGTSTHLSAELLKTTADISMTHIPYRGATPVIADVLAGQIDIAFGTLPSVAPSIASGSLKPLAVTSARRSPLLPDVPTLAESGVPGFEADVWYGLLAPAGTPSAIVARLHEAARRAADAEAFRKRARSEGMLLTLDGPEATARVIRAEQVKWAQVVRAQGVRAE